ncbi:bifunctional heptose 7-phosphate kinase/heptose 1-phosphate adenyltransferase [Sinorhizobium sp. A49]|uniref:D-glycero-beta-D-manno-heptose-7-phosphate kinase n=1 Tax=Sinorhizobium sp. A49 TaxID=1945861 RepID=UPI000985D62D|nr:D-glycero-beta-D-manno-heptose-7-phosphate kinase [Sinorhizobium sp. A49]OOG63079.1 bifunctional heptose 7-phosphate kinase/heptose 1-phosphate adenyltransferase [Sinorhizobium sp. A49]
MIDVGSIQRWQGKSILVLGDVMLDKFVYGDVERVSPEAPIPVLHFREEVQMLGGAANVARNVVALGGRAILVGVIGDDSAGTLISEDLTRKEDIVGCLVRAKDVPTTVKTRFVSGGQQIMRLDIETCLNMDRSLEDEVCSTFAALTDEVDAVILSDYAKGTLSKSVVQRVIELARARNLPIIVDPKTRDVARYAGATILTPNAAEAAMMTGCDCVDDDSAELAARQICTLAGVDSVVITRGPRGMTVFAPQSGTPGPVHIPTSASEVFDVSGAGDTVAATLALAIGAGEEVENAADIANIAAGISIGKRGTSIVMPHELRRSIREHSYLGSQKIVTNDEAVTVVADWQKAGLRVGFTNGCYDLLHPGHIQLLKKARLACDRLVVALNTDASVRRLKGEMRPVQSEVARATVMASIDSVDIVTLFTEDTPLALIQRLVPDVLVKGADYTVNSVVGADIVIGAGGEVVLVPLEEGHSTTSLIARANVRVA